jgi:SAM-dependent methyltransferase
MKDFKIKLDNLIFSKFYKQFFNTICAEVSDCKTMLDIGCGYNPAIKKLTNKMNYSLGIDAFQPSIDKGKGDQTHTEFLLGVIPECLQTIKDDTFDLVISLDFIEHLTKEQGDLLLSHMNRISKAKIILFTTNGFVPQNPYDDNIWQKHLSGWKIIELRSIGFTRFFGFGGFKSLRGERFSIKYKPRLLWKFISIYSQFITYRNPKLAYSLLCIKSKDKHAF